MGKFSGPLDCQKKLTAIKKKFLWLVPYNSIKESWIILTSFSYTCDNGDIINIGKGYETDFASIPQPFWAFGLAKDGTYDQPAVVHDKIYGTHEFSRKRCDDILYEAMGSTIPPTEQWKRDLIYSGVRLGGWAFY